MTNSLYILRTEENATGLFDTFFNGLFVLKGVAISLQMGWLLLIIIMFLSALRAIKKDCHKSMVLSQITPCIGIVFIGFIFFQPWDELFVNLRHSLHLVENNFFSFNKTKPIEATVDFLPYFLIGLLGKLGLPLPELSFCFSILGTIATLLASRKLLIAWKTPKAEVWGIPALSLIPLFWLNSGHGFSTTIFGATILWSIYFLFFSTKNIWGLFLLSLVPLVRMEGIWCTLLLLLFYYREKKRRNLTLLCLVPFLFLSIWRYWTFGSFIPLPIQYKNTLGNLFFIGVGLINLNADLVATFTLFALFISGALYLLDHKLFYTLKRPLILLGLLFIFVLPYYSSGGDWLPYAWGRYLFPFSVFSFLIAFTSIARAWEVLNAKELLSLGLVMMIIISILHNVPYGPSIRISHYLFSGRKILGELSLNRMKRRRMNYRIQYLSQLGDHFLRKTTAPESIIATSEVATVSYFAKRETLDMLGIANPELARAPLRDLPSLVMSPTEDVELPHLIFKRVNPDLIGKYLPDYLYLFDIIREDIMEEVPFHELTDEKIILAYQRWSRRFEKLVDGVYGGFKHLKQLGYSPCIVLFGNGHFSLYFVSSKALPDHLAKVRPTFAIKSIPIS